MKKRLKLTIALGFLIFINVSAKETLTIDSSGKQDIQLIKIETIEGEIIYAALSHITPDSIFIIGLENSQYKNKGSQYKNLKHGNEVSIAKNQVKKYKIKKGSAITHKDYTGKKKNRFWKIAGGFGKVLAQLTIAVASFDISFN